MHHFQIADVSRETARRTYWKLLGMSIGSPAGNLSAYRCSVAGW